MNDIDYSQLQEEVQEHWQSQGTVYLDQVLEHGANMPEGGVMQITLQPWAEVILAEPLLCVNALGFSSIADYIAYKRSKDGGR